MRINHRLPTLIIALALTLVLLSLTACQGTPKSTLSYNFKQGYGALVITPLENAPPAEIYQNSQFKIILKLENQGAYDLTGGKVGLLGFDDKYIQLFPIEQAVEELIGRRPEAPQGDIQLLEFSAQSKELTPGAETYTAPYFIKAEYKYKTEFSPTVCINPRLYEIYDSGCQVQPKTSFSGQGSPLAVTHLEEIISPGSPPTVEFRLTLKNKGRGYLQQATLGAARLGNDPLLCEFKGTPSSNKAAFLFKESQQEAILTCIKSLKDQNSYSTTLFVELNFDYSLKEKKTLTLRR